jgi:copper(I)-binding protein
VLWSSRASGSPRRLLIVAAAALIPVLAGCEAGTNAPVLSWHYPTVGAGTTAQDIAIGNVFVLGGPQAATIPAGQSTGLFFALVNTGTPDRLLSVTAPGTAASVKISGGTIALHSSQVVLLTGPRPEAILTGLTRPLVTGTVISIVMTFQKAGAVHLRVPVVAGSDYSTFSPPPTPAPTPTKHRHAAAGTSATVTPSPTASSTP